MTSVTALELFVESPLGIRSLNSDPVFKTNVFGLAYRSKSDTTPLTGKPSVPISTFCVQALSEYHPKEPDNSLYCPETIFPELLTTMSFTLEPSAKVSPFPY